VFEVFGAAALRRAAAEPIVVLDELGVMEEYAPLFQQAVHETLDRRGNCLVLGVLRLCDGAFVNSVKNRGDVCVYTVTPANRDALLDEIAPLIARVL
jgi:nucleoside-triphosphatase THEP1